MDANKLQRTQMHTINTKSPDFSGLFGLRRIRQNHLKVEMAGLEPASRTLLDKATTLISGV